MKALIIAAFVFAGCATPKTVYVDRVVKVGSCPTVEQFSLTRPRLRLVDGELYNPDNFNLVVKNYFDLISYVEFLELEAKRCFGAVKRCKESK